MTLILTEMSPFGIAMAADSAITCTQTQTGFCFVQPNSARKLQVIPRLNAGISCWGLGKIANAPTDEWLSNFIKSNTSANTLKTFADELSRQLNAKVPPNTSGSPRLGFHLAGFEDYNGTPTPSFYHIHDGSTTTLPQKVNPKQFNANQDMPPHKFQKISTAGKGWITRNGDYKLYAKIFTLLENFFNALKPLGIVVPNSQNLVDRAEYVIFQIRTMSEIYRLSNLIPGIGGGIHYLTISPNGIHSQGIRYF